MQTNQPHNPCHQATICQGGTISIKRNRRPTANMGRLISSEQLTKILVLSRQQQGHTFLREMLTITTCTWHDSSRASRTQQVWKRANAIWHQPRPKPHAMSRYLPIGETDAQRRCGRARQYPARKII